MTRLELTESLESILKVLKKQDGRMPIISMRDGPSTVTLVEMIERYIELPKAKKRKK